MAVGIGKENKALPETSKFLCWSLVVFALLLPDSKPEKFASVNVIADVEASIAGEARRQILSDSNRLANTATFL